MLDQTYIDPKLRTRLRQLATLLHPDRQVAISVLADAINKFHSTAISERDVHNENARISARVKAGTSPHRPTASHDRDRSTMDKEWLLRLLVLEETWARYLATTKTGMTSIPLLDADRRLKVIHFFAYLVLKSMQMEPPYATVCFGRWVYGCKVTHLFKKEEVGFSRHSHRRIDETMEKAVKDKFSGLPTLKDVEERERQAIGKLISFLAPKSTEVHKPALQAVARMARSESIFIRRQLLWKIVRQTTLTWSDDCANAHSLYLKGLNDYKNNLNLAGEHPEYLRSEVLIDPSYGAFRFGLNEPNVKRYRPCLPVWTMKNHDDSNTPPTDDPPEFTFDEPPEIDDAFDQALDVALTQRRERSRKYQYKPGVLPVFEVDGETLEPEPESGVSETDPGSASWSAAISADASQLCVYGEDAQGRLLLGTIFLSDLQVLEPGRGLELPLGGPHGPALFFSLVDAPDAGEDADYILYIDYLKESVAEPIVLAECSLRASVDDPLLPWFGLASSVYPYVTLQLHFDREEGVVQLRSPNLRLPEIYCTRDQTKALPTAPSNADDVRFTVPRKDVPRLADALGLPASYRRWVDDRDAPTGEGLLARLYGSVGEAAASLTLAQSAVFGALSVRARAVANDVWASATKASLLDLGELYPESATRKIRRPGGRPSPWPSVLVAMVPHEPQDSLTFVVTWTDLPEEPPKVEVFLDATPLEARCERSNGGDFIHLPGPIPGLSEDLPLPDWELSWEWASGILRLWLSQDEKVNGV